MSNGHSPVNYIRFQVIQTIEGVLTNVATKFVMYYSPAAIILHLLLNNESTSEG